MNLKRVPFQFNGENFYAYGFDHKANMIKALNGEEISFLTCSLKLIQAADKAMESLK